MSQRTSLRHRFGQSPLGRRLKQEWADPEVNAAVKDAAWLGAAYIVGKHVLPSGGKIGSRLYNFNIARQNRAWDRVRNAERADFGQMWKASWLRSKGRKPRVAPSSLRRARIVGKRVLRPVQRAYRFGGQVIRTIRSL